MIFMVFCAVFQSVRKEGFPRKRIIEELSREWVWCKGEQNETQRQNQKRGGNRMVERAQLEVLAGMLLPDSSEFWPQF